jgi:hypothetical protein
MGFIGYAVKIVNNILVRFVEARLIEVWEELGRRGEVSARALGSLIPQVWKATRCLIICLYERSMARIYRRVH